MYFTEYLTSRLTQLETVSYAFAVGVVVGVYSAV